METFTGKIQNKTEVTVHPMEYVHGITVLYFGVVISSAIL